MLCFRSDGERLKETRGIEKFSVFIQFFLVKEVTWQFYNDGKIFTFFEAESSSLLFVGLPMEIIFYDNLIFFFGKFVKWF